MINSINYSLFPSNEFFTFSNRSLAIAEPLRPFVPALVPFVDRALQCKVNFQASLEREQKNPFTPVVTARDNECDLSFLAFRTYVEACSFRSKDGWKEAAVKIMEVIRSYGWTAYGYGYKAQVAAETSMISELKNKYATEVETIGATPWFNEFETAKNALDLALQQSITGAPSGGLTIIETRPALVSALRSLFGMISLLNTNDDATAELKAAETALNALIVSSLATVKAAGTRAENTKKAESAKTEKTM